MKRLVGRLLPAAALALIAGAWLAQAQVIGPGSGITAGQLPGTATNDNASAGNVGEYLTQSIAAGSAVSITTATPINIASVALTAGDWECRGQISRTFTATTSFTQLSASLSTTTGTIGSPALGTQRFIASAANVPGTTVGPSSDIGPSRFSLNAGATVFLVASDTFTASTNAGFGYVACRRAR